MPDPTVSQFILKTYTRCNLACDYCYVYESIDQSWRGKPLQITDEVVRQAGHRILEHALRHHLPRVGVVLHGGEALLAGQRVIQRIVDHLRETAGKYVDVEISLQTNGTLLTEDFARYALREDIRIGISMDGDPSANDRHRTYPNGRSSHEATAAAVALMASPEYRRVFAGILATIDTDNDPSDLFEYFGSTDAPRIDLLLPHATWTSPPPKSSPGEAMFGDWLVKFFDLWYEAPPSFGVRFFEEIMHLLLGGTSHLETIGPGIPEFIVIETDGTYEFIDSLKVTYAGAPHTGLNVFNHAVDEVLQHPTIQAASRGTESLSTTCRSCRIVEVCGGGLYAHRYHALNGFSNPSVYCNDLTRLIDHVATRMSVDLRARAWPAQLVGYGAGFGASKASEQRPT